MFCKNTEPIEIKHEENHNIITSGTEWPKHKGTKTGDIFVDGLNLRTGLAVSYDKIGCRWVDQLDTLKILARDTNFAENPIIDENFQYKNILHAKLFWESADSERSSVDLENHVLGFRFEDDKNNSVAFDLGKTIIIPCNLKFGLNISHLIPPRDGIFRCFFGLSSHDQNTPSGSQQDFTGIVLELATVEKRTDKQVQVPVKDTPGFYRKYNEIMKTSQFKIGTLDTAGETLNKNITFLSHGLTTEKLFIKIDLNESDYVVSLFEDSDYTRPIEKVMMECNTQRKNLRYICAKNQFERNNGAHVTGSIEAVKLSMGNEIHG